MTFTTFDLTGIKGIGSCVVKGHMCALGEREPGEEATAGIKTYYFVSCMPLPLPTAMHMEYPGSPGMLLTPTSPSECLY